MKRKILKLYTIGNRLWDDFEHSEIFLLNFSSDFKFVSQPPTISNSSLVDSDSELCSASSAIFISRRTCWNEPGSRVETSKYTKDELGNFITFAYYITITGIKAYVCISSKNKVL